MPTLTAAHRDHARRALIASGYPIGDDIDALERLRRTELLEAVATAIALAEQRGPVRPAPPTDPLALLLPDWSAAAVDVLGFLQSRVAPATVVDDVVLAEHDGHELRTGALWALVLGNPDDDGDGSDYCPGCGAHADDPDDAAQRRGCRVCSGGEHPDGLEVRDGVVVQGNARVAALQRLADVEPTPADEDDRRADRMTWAPGDLVITPPPPDGPR